LLWESYLKSKTDNTFKEDIQIAKGVNIDSKLEELDILRLINGELGNCYWVQHTFVHLNNVYLSLFGKYKNLKVKL